MTPHLQAPVSPLGAPLPAPDLPDERWADRPFTWLGMALDRVALRGMRLAFASNLHPTSAELEAARDSAGPYLTADLAREPRRFFRFLDAAPQPVETDHQTRKELPDGVIVTRRFFTRYVPYHCGTRGACVENDCVSVDHWMHRPGPPRATVLALHGFTMGTPWLDAHVLMAATWFELGFDVALLALPFHGPRCPPSARYSGELFASWDVGRTNEAVRQAVHDVHLVKCWIERTTGAPVGLLGLSLGGYVAALTAGLCDDLAFVIPVVPPVFLDALPRSLLAVERSSAPALALDTLRPAYAVHCPLSFPLVVPRERVFIIGARGDCLVPPEHAHRLWQHWGKPSIHWYSGSHTAPFRRTRLIEAVREHFESLALAG
jgi:hypothetical protein